MIDRRTVFALWERRDDPNAAAAMLAIGAEYDRAGQLAPVLIRLWRIRAVEHMLSAKPGRNGEPVEAERVRAYDRALGMTRSDNRPTKFVSPLYVAQRIIEQGDTYSEGEARRRIETAFSVSPNTARARLRAAKPAIDEGRRQLARIMAANGLSSLVEHRR